MYIQLIAITCYWKKTLILNFKETNLYLTLIFLIKLSNLHFMLYLFLTTLWFRTKTNTTSDLLINIPPKQICGFGIAASSSSLIWSSCIVHIVRPRRIIINICSVSMVPTLTSHLGGGVGMGGKGVAKLKSIWVAPRSSNEMR